MTVEIALVFVLIACALYLFASERFPLDVTALLILVILTGIPLVFHSQWLLDRGVNLQAAFPTVAEGLSGLSSTATVTVLCMFILSSGIQRSGLVHVVSKRLFPLVGGSELRQILVIALLVGPVSGFINNTAAVAMAMPLVLDMARRSGTPAARLLLPVSFFGMLGGTLTLIGTSTNILASAILGNDPDFGRSIGMFEFTHVGLIVLGVGLVYFVTVGRWLMPEKDAARIAAETEETFVVELGIPENSTLIGQTLAESGFIARAGVAILRLVRGDQSHVKRADEIGIADGDIVLVRATLRQIMDLIKMTEVTVLSDFSEAYRVRGENPLVAVLLRNRALFNGRAAGETDYWKRYQAYPIGLDLNDAVHGRLRDEKLHVGEIMLLEIPATMLARLRRHPDVIVLNEFEDDFDRRRMWIAGGILAAVVATAALTPLPIVVTAIAGVIAMAVTGCVLREDLYSGVSWDVIFLLAGVIPLGIAMTKSGAAAWLAELVAVYAADWHPLLVLMALYLITTLLTEVVSNNATVVIMGPVALSLARSLGLEPLPLMLAVMFAASTSFLSPVGYQTNTMIFGTGVLRFTDFIKVGAPLNVLLLVVTSVGIWMFWPLRV